MATRDIESYYAGLLIIQYIRKPKASATIKAYATSLIQPQDTVQTLSFSPAPDTGSFKLVWNELETAAFDWDSTAEEIQTALQALAGLEELTVTGSIAEGLTITFLGVYPVAGALSVSDSTLADGVTPTVVTITEVDEVLPLTVQSGYNLIGDNLANGNQLDVLGKYAGVVRTSRGFTRQITLNDTDFLSLIKIAIIKNSAQSDLASIQQLLFDFFPGQLFVFDFKNMRMSYLLSYDVGGQDLVELFITQNLLPVPMAVQLAVIIYAPIIDSFFGFCDYLLPPGPLAGQSALNDYLDFSMESPWLAYENGIFPD